MTQRRVIYAIACSLCGAVIGFLLGVLLVNDERLAGGAFLAVGGAIVGLILGSRVIGVTGWTMLAGAVVGGVVAVLTTRIGKMALYGVPLGTIIGLGVGIGIEQNFRRPPD
jgi:MFS family permease